MEETNEITLSNATAVRVRGGIMIAVGGLILLTVGSFYSIFSKATQGQTSILDQIGATSEKTFIMIVFAGFGLFASALMLNGIIQSVTGTQNKTITLLAISLSIGLFLLGLYSSLRF